MASQADAVTIHRYFSSPIRYEDFLAIYQESFRMNASHFSLSHVLTLISSHFLRHHVIHMFIVNIQLLCSVIPLLLQGKARTVVMN